MKNRFVRIGIVVLAASAASAAIYGHSVLRDPPAQAVQRSRPPSPPATGRAVPRSAPAPSMTGHAVPRPTPPIVHPGPIVPAHVVVPYVQPGVSLGLWYGWPYPYEYPYPYGYPWPPVYTLPPGSVTGDIRLDVTPKDADVYVDGYFAGVIDNFNGAFHHLTVGAGTHVLEIRNAGFETLTVEVYVQPRQTITYRGAMSPAQAGESSAQIEPDTASPVDSEAPRGAPGDFRLDVTPRDSRIYVDGYYVGTVDNFKGKSQRLNLPPGPHHVTLQADGYEPLELDIAIQERQTTTYSGSLTRLKP